jgi:hypothetical protein
MEISSFAVGIEPIAWRDLRNAQLNAIFDRLTRENRIVMRGYCLKLSNLEAFDRVFKLILTLQTPVNSREDRIIAHYDGSRAKQPLHLSCCPTAQTSVYESDYWILPAKTTIALELFPDLETSQILDIRGLVSIEAKDGLSGTILLAPERRETFIPDFFPEAILATPPLEQWSYGLGQRTATI